MKSPFKNIPVNATAYTEIEGVRFTTDIVYLGSPTINSRVYESDNGETHITITRFPGKKDVEVRFYNFNKYEKKSSNEAVDMAIWQRTKNVTIFVHNLKETDLQVLRRAKDLVPKAYSWLIQKAYEDANIGRAEMMPEFIKNN